MDGGTGLAPTHAALDATRRLERTRLHALDRSLAARRSAHAADVTRSLGELLGEGTSKCRPGTPGTPGTERAQP